MPPAPQRHIAREIYTTLKADLAHLAQADQPTTSHPPAPSSSVAGTNSRLCATR
jgi:hypothetical protein